MISPSVTVVVCAYTFERWSELRAAISSALKQTKQPEEIVLVVDHNRELLLRAEVEFGDGRPAMRVIANNRRRGLSGARNTGLEIAGSDVVAFLDDDASADPDWLARLTAPYADPSVIAVGGAAAPRWPLGAERPATLPASSATARGELDWVVGCTYRGQPEQLVEVRNVMGCNMSFRRAIFSVVGGFSEHLGRLGKSPLGCEETELCIRARRLFPRSQIMFEPTARVTHHVSHDRLTWGYLRRRCYAEGLSKAAVATMVGQGQALQTERTYATEVLPKAVSRELSLAVRHRSTRPGQHLSGALALVIALTATAFGYLRGRVSARSAATGGVVPDLSMRPIRVRSRAAT